MTRMLHESLWAALLEYKNVIIHDCNLGQRYIDAIQEEIDNFNASQTEARADISLETRFLKVPHGVCIERDSKREHPVGQAVIMGMYYKYKDIYWPESRQGTFPAYIFDLDGTMANNTAHRSPYDIDKCGEDELIESTAAVLQAVRATGAQIIFLSGRNDTVEDITRNWLAEKLYLSDLDYKLYMRAAEDNRKDYIIKEELYWKYIAKDYKVLMAFDDRDQVVHLWRHLGIPTAQVNYGKF